MGNNWRSILSLGLTAAFLLLFGGCGGGSTSGAEEERFISELEAPELSGGGGSTSGAEEERTDHQQSTLAPRPLPNKFVGVFLPVSPIAGSGQIDYVARTARTAQDFGLDAINLVVDWKDLQPSESSYDFAALHELIKAVRSNGLYCILRIYFNAGAAHQAAPGWFLPELRDYYLSGGMVNPLPWDANYQTALDRFLGAMAQWFSANGLAFPDAMQIAAGGEFGEQVLATYYPPEPYDDFFTKLIGAEKKHIDYHVQRLPIQNQGSILAEFIITVNSLHTDPVRDSEFARYARDTMPGLRWIQTNAGVCSLRDQDYGPDNIDLLKQVATPLILEDSPFSCPVAEQSVESRLSIMQELETLNDFRFDAVTIDVSDLREENRAGIARLKQHVGL
jgi:hypothetical protein